MVSHPEVTEARRTVQARLESPRANYATPGLRPGGLAPLDGGSSRRNTVMRLCPVGQPAYIRVIRRRSRRTACSPGHLRSFCPRPVARGARCATPLGALRAPRAGSNIGGEHRGHISLDGRLSISASTHPRPAGPTTQETGFHQTRCSGTLPGARAGRGKPNTERPLVLSDCRSPNISVVPGRVRKSLVRPRTGVCPSGGHPV
jgi:hypothetical protein